LNDDMKIGFLITVRLKSTRLKRKVLLPLNGFTVIERVIQRAKSVVNSSNIILCTSTIEEDFPLIEYAEKSNINYFLGEPDDVLQRLLDASEKHQITHFIGITADNPLFSIHHANMIKEQLIDDPLLDYVFTTGMPIGINIYGINVKALKTVCEVKEQIDTEIWGPLINRPEIFNVREITSDAEYIREKYRLTMDEENDYKVIKTIYENFSKNDVLDLLSVYNYLDQNLDIALLNSHVKQRELNDEIMKKIDKYYRRNREYILEIKNKNFLNCK